MAIPSDSLAQSTTNNLEYIINVENSVHSWSLPLYKALNQGDWGNVEEIIKREPEATTARLTPFAETPLLVAVKTGQGLAFIRKLLRFMLPEALALTDYFGNTSPLELLSEDPSAFPSGMDPGFWHLLIYYCVPMKMVEMAECIVGGIKSPHSSSFKMNPFSRVFQEFHIMLWKVLETLVRPIKRIRLTKAMHHQAVQLIKQICSEIKCLDSARVSSILAGPFLVAVQNGIHEIVREVLETFPHAITFVDDENRSVFHLAVTYRHEKIFKTVHLQSGQYKMSLSLLLDNQRNNILHLAGYRP